MIVKTQVEVKFPTERAQEATLWLNAQHADKFAHQWLKVPQKVDIELQLDVQGKFSIISVNGIPL